MKSFNSDFPDNNSAFRYRLPNLRSERANPDIYLVGKVQSFLSLSLHIHALTTELLLADDLSHFVCTFSFNVLHLHFHKQ
jgi:hypothetical protein